MNVQLTHLVAKSFRGIRDQAIPLDGRNFLLVGENGSGKSSFVDALEYAFTGELERLKRRDVKEKQSIPFIGSRNDDVLVELTCRVSGREMQLKMGYPYKTPSIPKALREWYDLARSRPFILRRAQILRFVDARGADRYKQVSTLIGLDEVDEIEETWRNLANQWKRREQAAASSEREGVKSLRGLVVGIVQAEESQVVEAVNQRLAKLGIQSIGGMQELPQRVVAIQVGAEATEAAQKAERLLTLAAELTDTEAKLLRLLDLYGAFYAGWQAFTQEKETLKEALFRLLLEKGKTILEQHPEIDRCPLCCEPIRDRDALLDDVRKRLGALKSVQKKQEELDDQLDSLRSEVTTACSLIQKAREDREAAQARRVLVELEGGLLGFREALGQQVLDGEFTAPEDIRKADWVQEIPTLSKEKAGLEGQAGVLQPSELERERIVLAIWLGQVEEKWEELEQRHGKRERIRRVCVQVEEVHAAFVQAREKRLEEIHARIEGLVNDYYHRLHPNEGYGDIQLPMESRGKGVGLRTSFYDIDDTHPLGFYSEAHLDSLGIAIFLAFIKEFNGDLKLLVLDDVLTTIDRSHRQRMASLVCAEFSDHQIVLTTHDRLWAEELITTMRAANLQPLALYLVPWDKRKGVDWKEFLEERWDEYRERAETHAQSAVADTGRDLEKFLSKMRYNLCLSVPARPDDRYTIGDLYDPFFGWFKKRSVQCPSAAFDRDLEKTRTQLDVYWRQRNWAGAHYNEWGESLTFEEACGFIDPVAKLVALFHCPRCGSLVEYEEKSGVLFCSHCKGKSDGACWRVVK